MDDNKKEVRRENKQVRSLKRLRTLKSKGKTGTNRYKKLREKVYNPFPDKSPLKQKGDAMVKTKNPIHNFNRISDPTPDKAFEEMVFKQKLNEFNKRSAAAQKKEASKLISKKQPMNPKILPYKYPESGAIEMTSNPVEWFIGGGGVKAGIKVGKAGFDLAKGLVKNQIKRPSTFIKKAANYSKAVVGRAITDIFGDEVEQNFK